MQISDMVERTREVTALFDEVVPRTWGIEAMMVELVGEVGTLADEIMLQEGYRRTRSADRLRLEDEVVDVLFMLVRVADYYGIDLDEAYVTMLDKTEAKLRKVIEENERKASQAGA
jgi:NTP pyrophosphatase (non-canonical NTP hydrolase)